MKAPKILPWIASKAGIGEELAINLWRRAAGEAEEMTGDCSSSEYYRLAVELFIDLADEEGEKCAALEPLSIRFGIARLRSMRHCQERIWQGHLVYAHHACRLFLSSWERALTRQKHAA
jgi:hypothetical protein